MRVITWRYLQIKLGWENERRGKGKVDSSGVWKWNGMEKLGEGKGACGKVNKNFGIAGIFWGFATRGNFESSRTKVRATDGHLDRSARLFLNAPLLSWAVSKVSRVLGFARGDQYYWSRASQVFEKTSFRPWPRSFRAKYVLFFLSAARITIHLRPALIALDGRKWNSIFIRLRDFPQGEGRGGQPTHARARSPFISGFLSKRRPSATGIKFNKFED